MPFVHKFVKAEPNAQFGKFLDVLKKLHVNIHFIDTLSQMPTYAKFLKEVISKKRMIDEHETIALDKKYGAVVLNKLLVKLKDPSSFSIPCLMGNVSIDRLCVILVRV